MTLWQAFILGCIQGVTEFLPISSSGHLLLAEKLLGFEEIQNYTLFNLTCHIGTLLALFICFFPTLKERASFYHTSFWQIVLATLPLFPIAFFLKPLKSLFNSPYLLGPCFLLSASFLFLGLYWRSASFYLARHPWKSALTIGISQAVAIFPGISRSGTTISTAKIIGWSHEEALRFSFLLAIPTILGGTVLEIGSLWKEGAALQDLNAWTFFIGFATSSLTGYLSLSWLLRYKIQELWHYFAWYCLLIGIFVSLSSFWLRDSLFN